MNRATILLLVASLFMATGCASDRADRGATSTLGTDMLRAPRGVTIPPPSIGVDLVSYPPVSR
ncbi:MAG: hypothetical protein U0835_27385 [Isosphaeraceae bacterium]